MAVASASQYYWEIYHTSYQSNGILNFPFWILSSRSTSTFFHPIGLTMETTRYQYQHGSSFGVSILLGNISHFIPIQWYSELSILDTEQQIHFNILSPYRPHNGNDPLLRSQSKVIRLKYIPWLRSQNFQKFQTVHNLFGQKIWPFLHFNLQKTWMHHTKESSPERG